MAELRLQNEIMTVERNAAEVNQLENAKTTEELCEDKKALLVEIDNITCNVATLVTF